jgi:hypothetical protein
MGRSRLARAGTLAKLGRGTVAFESLTIMRRKFWDNAHSRTDLDLDQGHSAGQLLQKGLRTQSGPWPTRNRPPKQAALDRHEVHNA